MYNADNKWIPIAGDPEPISSEEFDHLLDSIAVQWPRFADWYDKWIETDRSIKTIGKWCAILRERCFSKTAIVRATREVIYGQHCPIERLDPRDIFQFIVSNTEEPLEVIQRKSGTSHEEQLKMMRQMEERMAGGESPRQQMTVPAPTAFRFQYADPD